MIGYNTYHNSRVNALKNDLRQLIPGIIDHCIGNINNNELYYRNLLNYSNQILSLMHTHLHYTFDVRDLYYWLGLAPVQIRATTIEDFFRVYDETDGALSIMDKLTTDLFDLQTKGQILLSGYVSESI